MVGWWRRFVLEQHRWNFFLWVGVRDRGAPLSPLMIEPLAIALQISLEIRALEVGGIRECTALYADDMVLFLFTGFWPIFTSVFLHIWSRFARWSGLKVNWTNSSAMAIDAGAQSSANSNIPIVLVTKFTYLGIQISPRVGDYMSLNLLSLIPIVRRRLEACQNISLSLIGRVNLLKN